MLGLLLSGVVHQFISIELIQKNLGRNSLLDVFKAALIGVPLPLCSCSVIPTAVTLKKSGASNGATSAFLIATPESGIDSILMTYALIDLPMTILRPIAALCSAIAAGFLQLIFNPSGGITPQATPPCQQKSQGHYPLKNQLYAILHYGFYQLLKDIAQWLAIGLVLGALIMHFVPEELFLTISQTQEKLLILLIGIPFYICASATTPIAAALMLKGISPGTALLLLLVGPATNISNLAILHKYIGKRGVAINVFAITSVALVLSYLTDLLYQLWQWDITIELESSHHHSSNYLGTLLTVIFIVLLINALWAKSFKQRVSP